MNGLCLVDESMQDIESLVGKRGWLLGSYITVQVRYSTMPDGDGDDYTLATEHFHLQCKVGWSSSASSSLQYRTLRPDEFGRGTGIAHPDGISFSSLTTWDWSVSYLVQEYILGWVTWFEVLFAEIVVDPYHIHLSAIWQPCTCLYLQVGGGEFSFPWEAYSSISSSKKASADLHLVLQCRSYSTFEEKTPEGMCGGNIISVFLVLQQQEHQQQIPSDRRNWDCHRR